MRVWWARVRAGRGFFYVWSAKSGSFPFPRATKSFQHMSVVTLRAPHKKTLSSAPTFNHPGNVG
jgi:hypothetical protein